MVEHSNKSNHAKTPRLTRRDFLGAAGGAALSVAALGLPAVLGACRRSQDTGGVDVLSVSTSQVVTLDSYTEIEDIAPLCDIKEVAKYPKGTMLFSSGDQLAAALNVGESANPLSTCSLVKLADGSITKALNAAVGVNDGFSLFTVRASNTTLAWVESNYLTSDWAVYSAQIGESANIGQPVKLDEGNADYDTPELAVIGSTVYWIVQPTSNGPRASENSHLKAAGGAVAAEILTSRGRFNGGLSTSGNVLTAMPRADTSSGVHYELTAIMSGTGSVVAKQILPRSYRPSNAVYVNNAFAFTIPASYDYGGGIANVGTYFPIAGNQWLRLTKQSLTPPGMCYGWLFAKSGSRTVFVDTKGERYFVVDAPDNCESYGDYSVCTGEVNAVYNYATVRSGQKSSAQQENENADTTIGASSSGATTVLRNITPKLAI